MVDYIKEIPNNKKNSKKELKNENLFVHKGLFRPGAKPSDYYEDHPTEVIQAPVVVRTPQVRYYKVRPGDTLTEIASRNGTTVSQLCQLNVFQKYIELNNLF